MPAPFNRARRTLAGICETRRREIRVRRKAAVRRQEDQAGADFQMIDYPGAVHAFTNPDADRHKMNNIAYNADADQKSWEQMKQFFTKLFG